MAAREVPRVRCADLDDVPADRADDGIAVCVGVSGVRPHTDDGEMAFFHMLDSDTYSDRFARAAAAGRGQLAGVCGGTDVFRVCAAEQRTRGDFDGEIPASAIAGVHGGNS